MNCSFFPEVNTTNLAPQHSTDSIYTKSFSYIPDFSLKATSTITYLKIRRAHYIASRKITLISKTTVREEEENEAFDREMQKASWLSNASNNSDLMSEHKKGYGELGRTSSHPTLPVNKLRSESVLSGRSFNSEHGEDIKPTSINENYVYHNSPKHENSTFEIGAGGDKKEGDVEEEAVPMMSCDDHVRDNIPLTKC